MALRAGPPAPALVPSASFLLAAALALAAARSECQALPGTAPPAALVTLVLPAHLLHNTSRHNTSAPAVPIVAVASAVAAVLASNAASPAHSNHSGVHNSSAQDLSRAAGPVVQTVTPTAAAATSSITPGPVGAHSTPLAVHNPVGSAEGRSAHSPTPGPSAAAVPSPSSVSAATSVAPALNAAVSAHNASVGGGVEGRSGMQHSHASSLSGSHGRSLMAQGLYEAILRFTARDLKLCNALRCMERLRWIEAAQSQVCGAWENDMFVFSNLCDMMWFNCLTERGYQRVDGQLCGLSPNQGSGSNTSPPFQIPAAAANYPALQQQPQHPLEAPQSNAAPLGSFAGHDQV